MWAKNCKLGHKTIWKDFTPIKQSFISIHGKLYLTWILHLISVLYLTHAIYFHSVSNFRKSLISSISLMLYKKSTNEKWFHAYGIDCCLPYQKWPITEAGDEIFDELFVVKRWRWKNCCQIIRPKKRWESKLLQQSM